jgi:tripartite-type tricarboxylate transporter receptor subunit TctC
MHLPLRLAFALVLSATFAVNFAHAQAWPGRNVTDISPYPPGGTNDVVARLFADGLQSKLGAPFVVENRAGAAGIVGSSFVSRAAPDGYTLLSANNGSHIIQPLVSSQTKYDAIKDFTPITRFAVAYQFIGVNAELPIKSVSDLIDYAKKNPGKLNYGSAGSGSFGNFAGAYLSLLAGIDIVHIPYRGSAAALSDLLSGQIQFMIDPIVLTQMAGGKVRVIATTAPQRFPSYPDIPTVKESGLPQFDVVGWFGLFGPPGLPPEIVKKLADTAAEIGERADIEAKLLNVGLLPAVLTPEQFVQLIEHDRKVFSDIKEKANIQQVD